MGGEKLYYSHALIANHRVQYNQICRHEAGKYRQALENNLTLTRFLLNAFSVFVLGMVPGVLF